MDFETLSPEFILDCIEDQDYLPTGTLTALNSYENRVFEIGIEDAEPLIAKFYRPGRWNEHALWEEHQFVQMLDDSELPVIPPLVLASSLPGKPTLGKVAGFYYCLYPKFRGTIDTELNPERREWIGRFLGRLHNIGASFRTLHRPVLNPESYGWKSLDLLLKSTHTPDTHKEGIEQIISQTLDLIGPLFDSLTEVFAVHGDCHLGNVLWNRDGLYLLDFDDMLMAPPVQDLWMLFSGTPEEIASQKEDVLKGYSLFRAFDQNSFILEEPLRTLRMIRYAAWIGQRFDEEIFRKTFPHYADARYWDEFSLSLREQFGLICEIL